MTSSQWLLPSTAAAPPSELQQSFMVHSDVVVILAALLCALICVVGLAFVTRYACFHRFGNNDNRDRLCCSCSKEDLLPEESFKSWSSYKQALWKTGYRLVDRVTARSSAETEVKVRSGHEMKKSLSWWDLFWFGIGAVIGAGIFVLTGQEAKQEVGPAIVLSFIVARSCQASIACPSVLYLICCLYRHYSSLCSSGSHCLSVGTMLAARRRMPIRILEHFVAVDRANGGASPCLAEYEQMITGSPSLTPLTRVARLIDGYLAEVAPDVNLKPSKFQSLADAVPDYARTLDNGLYRAIDVYLKV